MLMGLQCFSWHCSEVFVITGNSVSVVSTPVQPVVVPDEPASLSSSLPPLPLSLINLVISVFSCHQEEVNGSCCSYGRQDGRVGMVGLYLFDLVWYYDQGTCTGGICHGMILHTFACGLRTKAAVSVPLYGSRFGMNERFRHGRYNDCIEIVDEVCAAYEEVSL